MPSKNEIIAELYQSKEFNDCINRMNPEHLRDDLRSEVMLVLLDTPDDKFALIRNIRYYAVRIIIQLIQSNTSPFFRKYRGIVSPISSTGDFISIEGDQSFDQTIDLKLAERGARSRTRMRELIVGLETETTQARLLRELQEDKVKSYIKGLYWYDKGIVELYIKLGNYRAIEAETGIPWESCYSTIRKVIKEIRENVLTPQPV